LLSLAAAVAGVLLGVHGQLEAQGRGAGAAPPAPTPRAAAPINLVGYWVSIVSEDWRWRMGVGQKGDFGYLPLNAEGRRVGNAWDPAQDAAAGNQCKAYGAAAIMRVPARLHITWENDTTLEIEIDNGTQTRQLHFGGSAPADVQPTWQGYSVANWDVRGGRGRQTTPPKNGDLRVVTTKMRAGYYFKHGVPYSENATLTEYFATLSDEGADYLAVTTIVDDRQYLAQPFVRTLQFRREPDGARWKPAPCA
jgi:hypothetical protein